MPARAAAAYNITSELAKELSVQAQATQTPPTATTILGPKRSTNHPSMGTSHVSVAMKILKATWIAVVPQ
jgi:hypothetical protein